MHPDYKIKMIDVSNMNKFQVYAKIFYEISLIARIYRSNAEISQKNKNAKRWRFHVELQNEPK